MNQFYNIDHYLTTSFKCCQNPTTTLLLLLSLMMMMSPSASTSLSSSSMSLLSDSSRCNNKDITFDLNVNRKVMT